ncbi:FecR family protein [Pedobacter nyackensis]|uniref:FecR family protein n=1 Tax=Pedobacter nyackensis TaxID=475255 RepID=UPI0029311AD3|nr:FecR domain-containing protein [Pedobacter nyackensis]
MNARLAHLYQRYIDNTCTAAEREELLLIVAEDPENELIPTLMDGTWDQVNSEKLVFPAEDAVLYNILTHHQESTIKKISWYRYAAAIAAIITVVVSGIYFYQNNTNTSLIQSKTADIQAGKNRATLTLSNGKVINLDNAANGELAEQSGLTITKTADGQILYNIAASTEKKNLASNELAFNTITTPRGGKYQINLPDGSKIWLNAASSLKYPITFGEDKRKVELTGEAYFEVAKAFINEDKGLRKPFVVKTDKQEVEVLGTHFNINSYADENRTKTTLLEGIVRVTSLGGQHTSSILKPGQQTTLINNSLTTDAVDAEEAIAWKNGYFQFNESDLGSIMRQLSRWYDVDVVFEGRSPTDLFHFRVPRDQSLMEILKIFEINGINLKIEGRKLIVKS